MYYFRGEFLNKFILRPHYKALRDSICQAQKMTWSKQALALLKDSNLYKNSESIFSFISFGSEISSLELIKEILKSGKTLLVPKILKGEDIMIPVQIEKLSDLKKGCFGILEPSSNTPYTLPIDLTLVPGLLFNKKGYRIGYGKGYYDKFLKTNKTKSLGLCFDFQIEDINFEEDHDIAVDYICTDKAIYKIGGYYE